MSKEANYKLTSNYYADIVANERRNLSLNDSGFVFRGKWCLDPGKTYEADEWKEHGLDLFSYTSREEPCERILWDWNAKLDYILYADSQDEIEDAWDQYFAVYEEEMVVEIFPAARSRVRCAVVHEFGKNAVFFPYQKTPTLDL
jgi:hypothetical protein